MTSKNNKRFILSGILLAVSVALYALYEILLGDHYANYGIKHTVAWGRIIFTIIGSVILLLYCFGLHKTKASKIVYFVGFGVYSLFDIYIFICNIADGYFDLYTLENILSIAVISFMITAKIKINKNIAIAGTVVFADYALAWIVTIYDEFSSGLLLLVSSFIWLTFYAYFIVTFIAFFNIWLAEGGNMIFKKKAAHSMVKTPLEDNLISLKQLLDNGVITEQEYKQKKTDILNKL